jgi:hypothetical protein
LICCVEDDDQWCDRDELIQLYAECKRLETQKNKYILRTLESLPAVCSSAVAPQPALLPQS